MSGNGWITPVGPCVVIPGVIANDSTKSSCAPTRAAWVRSTRYANATLDLEAILFSGGRKASELSERPPQCAAMAAFDRSRGRSVFRAFESDAQAAANPANDFKPVRPCGSSLHCHSQTGLFNRSRQAEYVRLTALLVWARTSRKLSGG